jgi:hypothetical protein
MATPEGLEPSSSVLETDALPVELKGYRLLGAAEVAKPTGECSRIALKPCCGSWGLFYHRPLLAQKRISSFSLGLVEAEIERHAGMRQEAWASEHHASLLGERDHRVYVEGLTDMHHTRTRSEFLYGSPLV